MNSPLLHTIKQYITTHNLIPDGSKIIIGLSGGPDSVFLLYVMKALAPEKNLSLVAAHLNHGWRAEAADDAQFCSDLAQNLEIPFVQAKLADLELNLKFNGSQEELGRKARRNFFEKICKEHGAQLIALAHHAQDQQETFFIRLMRGSSLSGLSAIRPKQGTYIRPLLTINKADILDYLHANKIPYRIDATNESQEYLRNRIRTNVLPALKNADQRFENNFAATLQRLQETEQFLEKLTATTFNDLLEKDNTNVWVNIAAFNNLEPLLQDRIIIHWLCIARVPFAVSQNFINEIKRFLQHTTKKGEHTLHLSWKLIKVNGLAKISTH